LVFAFFAFHSSLRRPPLWQLDRVASCRSTKSAKVPCQHAESSKSTFLASQVDRRVHVESRAGHSSSCGLHSRSAQYTSWILRGPNRDRGEPRGSRHTRGSSSCLMDALRPLDTKRPLFSFKPPLGHRSGLLPTRVTATATPVCLAPAGRWCYESPVRMALRLKQNLFN
jgi:hypothetical protein